MAEAAEEPRCGERELVKAYRNCGASRRRYPNSGELLRTVAGTGRLSGGITEVNPAKHEKLEKAWRNTGVNVANSSWRAQLGRDGVLSCPSSLESSWLLSMDPMTFSQSGSKEDNLNRSDLDLLAYALAKYFNSGQPGIACFFAYGMQGIKLNDSQLQFWDFVEELAGRLSVRPNYFWLPHIDGNRNLAGLLFSDCQLASEFNPPNVNAGRGPPNGRSGRHENLPNASDLEMPAGTWSSWRAFPDPRNGAYLYAPFGPGVYELRNARTSELVLFGRSKNLAWRMSSLLPRPHGAGSRRNEEKRKYVLAHLAEIECRTKACGSDALAAQEEQGLRMTNSYVFPT
ncbi:MAG: hypothetical protein OXH76_01565 [Boseongicola sp.]|nr:hypothetical protein [Boseongicola sp.]